MLCQVVLNCIFVGCPWRNKSQRPRDQNRKYPSTVSFCSETKGKRLLRRLQESSKNEICQEKKDEHVIITTTYPAAGYVSIHKLLTGFTFSGYFHFVLYVVK